MAGGLICKLWIINLKSTSLSVRCLPPRSILARIAAAVIKSWATAQDTFRIFRTILAILYSSTFRSVQSVCIILAILHQSTFRIFKLFLQYLQYLQYWTKVLFCQEGGNRGTAGVQWASLFQILSTAWCHWALLWRWHFPRAGSSPQNFSFFCEWPLNLLNLPL